MIEAAIASRTASAPWPARAGPPPYLLGVWLGDGHSAQGVITCAVENAEHYRIQLAEIGEELHDPQPSRQGQTTISCSISKCLGTKRQESLHGRLRGPWVTPEQAYQPRRAGRPSKLTPELQEQILTAIREGGCTYADACLKAGISKSTFQLWKKKGQEQKRGHYLDFLDELKEAEAGFRATRLQRLVDAAEKSKVRVRKTVRSVGEGDDAKIFQEVVEDTVLPDPKWDAWLLERKYPEEFSRKHLEVNAKVTNTEPPPVMQLVIVDQVKKREDAEAAAPTGETPAEEPPATE